MHVVRIFTIMLRIEKSEMIQGRIDDAVIVLGSLLFNQFPCWCVRLCYI